VMGHVGDLLAEMLMRYGMTHVFGQPDSQTAALYDGIATRAPRLRHILIRDERSAAYAADAFARLTGRPGAPASLASPLAPPILPSPFDFLHQALVDNALVVLTGNMYV
jgi:acetolactate synthase I/II/III large subunit